MSKLISVDLRPAPGLALLTVYDFGDTYARQLWAKCKARRPGTCDATGASYRPGAEVYRPVGNPQNRCMRFLALAIDP